MVARCPHCGQLSRVAAAGHYRCPSCRQIFEADAANLTPEAPAAPLETTLVYDDGPPASPDAAADAPVNKIAVEETAVNETAVAPESTVGRAAPRCERCGIYEAAAICRDCGRMICPACAHPVEGDAAICHVHLVRAAAPPPPMGFFALLIALLSRPAEAFSRMLPGAGGAGRAIVFNLVFGLFGAAFALAYSVWLPASIGGVDAFASLFADATGGDLVGFVVALIFLLPVALLTGILLTSLVFHGAFRLFGAGKNGFGASLKVICYAQGAAAVFNVLPLIGNLFAVVWFCGLTIVGAAKLHGVGYGRVAAAVLLLAAIIFCIGIAIGLAGYAGGASGGVVPHPAGKLI